MKRRPRPNRPDDQPIKWGRELKMRKESRGRGGAHSSALRSGPKLNFDPIRCPPSWPMGIWSPDQLGFGDCQTFESWRCSTAALSCLTRRYCTSTLKGWESTTKSRLLRGEQVGLGWFQNLNQIVFNCIKIFQLEMCALYLWVKKYVNKSQVMSMHPLINSVVKK